MEGFERLRAKQVGHVLSELGRIAGTVNLKFTESGVFRAKTLHRGWGQSLELARPPGMGLSYQDQDATVQVILDGEIYFFLAKVVMEGRRLTLRLNGEIYRLARRRSKRWPVPTALTMRFTTKRVNDRLTFLTFVVSHLSPLGARLVLPRRHPALDVGVSLLGGLRIGGKVPIDATGDIRHLRTTSDGGQILGIKWTEFSSPTKLDQIIHHLQAFEFQRASKR